jgi:flavin-dependent dehydrogenase
VDARGERATISGRVVAGAFGKGVGLAARRAGTPPSRFIAWKAHHRGQGPRATVELHAFPGGYCGVAPIEGGRWNVCGLATREVFARAGGTLPGLLAWASQSNAALAARWRQLDPEPARPLTVASLDFARRSPVAEPMVQIGDAAAGIAPLAGDGIGMALASAALAEPWLAARLAGAMGQREMLTGYAREWRRVFRRRLAVGTALQELLIAPRAAAGALAILGAFPELADRLVRETAR